MKLEDLKTSNTLDGPGEGEQWYLLRLFRITFCVWDQMLEFCPMTLGIFSGLKLTSSWYVSFLLVYLYRQRGVDRDTHDTEVSVSVRKVNGRPGLDFQNEKDGLLSSIIANIVAELKNRRLHKNKNSVKTKILPLGKVRLSVVFPEIRWQRDHGTM